MMSRSTQAATARSRPTAPPAVAALPTEALLIVDDEAGMRDYLQRTLEPHFLRVETAADAASARRLLRASYFDLLITDIRLPGPLTGAALVRETWEHINADLDVIFITGYADAFDEIEALKNTNADVLRKPFHPEQLLALIERTRQRRHDRHEQFVLRRQLEQRPPAKQLVGESEPLRDIMRTIRQLAPMPTTVLIKGETGTGKELVARALHDLSGRRGAYVPVNCGAISPELIEGELFGHLKGAFTGAHQARNGLFSHADGGTLFLDEIGEMPLGMQAKLLRVLEERHYRPVGGSQEIPVDTRVIAATNRDLAAEVLAGRFRKDLYYRINVVDLRLPPLRERKTDIPRLAEYFLAILSAELGVPAPALTPWDLQQMQAYDWPGNCRELRNVIERSLLLGRPPAHYLVRPVPTPPADLTRTQGQHMPTALDASAGADGVDRCERCEYRPGRDDPAVGTAPVTTVEPPPLEAAQNQSLEHIQRSHILNALACAGGNKTLAARSLGVSRKTVERKLKEWERQARANTASVGYAGGQSGCRGDRGGD